MSKKKKKATKYLVLRNIEKRELFRKKVELQFANIDYLEREPY